MTIIYKNFDIPENYQVLHDYYKDSEVKQKRRYEILETIKPIIIREGLLTFTTTELARKSNIDRRSLYRYYSNRDDIIVDIAYIISTDLNLNLKKELDNAININNFKDTLLHFVSNIKSNIDYYSILLEFDIFYKRYSEQDETITRYNKCMTTFWKEHYIIYDSLKKLNLKLSDKELINLCEVIEQSLFSYVLRVTLKKDESTRYNDEQINLFIKIIENEINLYL